MHGLRLRRAHRRRPARRVGRASCARPQRWSALSPAHALLRPGDRRHRAADDDGGGGGGQRRLPDEADDRAPASRTARAAWCARRSRSWCAACSSRATADTLTEILQRGRGRAGTGQARRHPRLRGGGQDGHRPEDRRQRPLLDDRPRGVLRRLRARGASGPGGARRRSTRRGGRTTRAATSRRRSSRASPSPRCGGWPSRPTIPTRVLRAAAAAPPSTRRRPPPIRAAGRRRGRSRAARGRAGADARPARPLRARGGDRRGAPRPDRGAARARAAWSRRRPEPGAEHRGRG